MRVFAIAADVIMGVILGAFLYVALSRTWPAATHPAVALTITALSIFIVLVRRPNGSMAWRQERR